MTKIKVLIVDDHPLMREALRMAIKNESGMHVVGEARNGNEAVAQATALSPDVIIMDIFMPGKDGLVNRLAGVLYTSDTAPVKKQKENSALTPREMEIIEPVGQGLTNYDIGKKLTISDGTVRTRLHHILDKLGLANRNQLVLFATRPNEK